MGHLIFIDINGKEWDFGQGPDNLGEYQFCIDPEELGEGEPYPKYIDKEFKIIYNINKEAAYLTSDGMVDCPTIIETELIKK